MKLGTRRFTVIHLNLQIYVLRKEEWSWMSLILNASISSWFSGCFRSLFQLLFLLYFELSMSLKFCLGIVRGSPTVTLSTVCVLSLSNTSLLSSVWLKLWLMSIGSSCFVLSFRWTGTRLPFRQLDYEGESLPPGGAPLDWLPLLSILDGFSTQSEVWILLIVCDEQLVAEKREA